MDLNVTSLLHAVRAVLPHMQAGSSIIPITSQAARDGGGPGAIAYAASMPGPNFGIQEYLLLGTEECDALFPSRHTMTDGMFYVSDGLGLGVSFNEEEVRRSQHVQGFHPVTRLLDGPAWHYCPCVEDLFGARSASHLDSPCGSIVPVTGTTYFGNRNLVTSRDEPSNTHVSACLT